MDSKMMDTSESDTDNKMITETASDGDISDIDLKKLSFTLDSWARSCDTVLESLQTQLKRLDQIKGNRAFVSRDSLNKKMRE